MLDNTTVESIKKGEEISLPVMIDKIPHFPEENILENTKREIQDYIDLILNLYSKDIKQSDQNDQEEMKNLLFATTGVIDELDVELDYDNLFDEFNNEEIIVKNNRWSYWGLSKY